MFGVVLDIDRVFYFLGWPGGGRGGGGGIVEYYMLVDRLPGVRNQFFAFFMEEFTRLAIVVWHRRLAASPSSGKSSVERTCRQAGARARLMCAVAQLLTVGCMPRLNLAIGGGHACCVRCRNIGQ